MSKLDSKPLNKAQHSMSPHDLNHVYDFTSSTGMILPLVCDVLNPGEKIDTIIDLSQTRTMPLDSAAYLNLDLHVDYFFVPMTLLMSKFESFIYRIKDYYSAANNTYFDLPLLNLDNVKKDIQSNGYNRVINIGVGANFDDLAKGCLRLFDHLGYGSIMNSSSTGWSSDSAYNPSVFPWALLAYNAAYSYYYINDEYEQFENILFNTDYNVNNAVPLDLNNIVSLKICSLKYRNKYHDYFTRIKASPIVSGQNLLDSAGSLSLAKSWLSREQTTTLAGNAFPALVDGVVGVNGNAIDVPGAPNVLDTRTNFAFGSGSPTYDSNPSVAWRVPNGLDINTANLRALFANEKLWTITGMNRKQYDAQTLAHFGFDVPVDVMHQVQHIGHHLYNLKVGEVISTAGTVNQPLATVAGKGYSFDNPENKDIKFTAPCHGVFIALYSSAIHRNYFGSFRKENAIANWQDFYQPEFDNLGMQPLFLFETRQDKFGSSSTFDYGAILGWQYRYEQFKSKYDRSTLAFANDFIGASNVIYSGPFSSWGPSDLPLEGLAFSSQVYTPSNYWKWILKESPSELNNMMSIAYDPRWYSGATGESLNYVSSPWTMYATDPLVHHAIIKYHKISTMSTYSLPKLND